MPGGVRVRKGSTDKGIPDEGCRQLRPVREQRGVHGRSPPRCSRCVTTTSSTSCRRSPAEDLRDKVDGGGASLPQAGHHHRGLSPGPAPVRHGRPHHVPDRRRRRVPRRPDRGRGPARRRLRRRPLVVVDPSPQLPPDRPPLSKQVLAGDWEPDRADAAARRPGCRSSTSTCAWASRPPRSTPATRTADPVRRLDRSRATGIVLAMGAAARHLPGDRARRACTCCAPSRTAWRCGPTWTPARRRVVVIGAGFIGAEVAATCRERGLEVTMIEAAPVPLRPGAARRRSAAFIADLHREHGVDVRLGVGVDGLEADGDGRVRAVRMADGTDGRRRRRRRRHRRGAATRAGSRAAGLDARQRRASATRPASPPRASSRRATWPAGPTRASARSCGSSSGRTRSSRASTPAAACSPSWIGAPVSRSRRSRGSGPTSTTASSRWRAARSGRRRAGHRRGQRSRSAGSSPLFRRGDRCTGGAGRQPTPPRHAGPHEADRVARLGARRRAVRLTPRSPRCLR